MKFQDVFVIRCSLLDGFNPIEEIDRVLEAKGCAWFGKYGQSLGLGIQATVADQQKSSLAVLVYKSKSESGGAYVFRVYRAKKVAIGEAPKSGTFPAYYEKFLNRIGSWILLEEYVGPPIELHEIKTRSSAQPVLMSLSRSMRGHFSCVIWSRNDA